MTDLNTIDTIGLECEQDQMIQVFWADPDAYIASTQRRLTEEANKAPRQQNFSLFVYQMASGVIAAWEQHKEKPELLKKWSDVWAFFLNATQRDYGTKSNITQDLVTYFVWAAPDYKTLQRMAKMFAADDYVDKSILVPAAKRNAPLFLSILDSKNYGTSAMQRHVIAAAVEVWNTESMVAYARRKTQTEKKSTYYNQTDMCVLFLGGAVEQKRDPSKPCLAIDYLFEDLSALDKYKSSMRDYVSRYGESSKPLEWIEEYATWREHRLISAELGEEVAVKSGSLGPGKQRKM